MNHGVLALYMGRWCSNTEDLDGCPNPVEKPHAKNDYAVLGKWAHHKNGVVIDNSSSGKTLSNEGMLPKAYLRQKGEFQARLLTRHGFGFIKITKRIKYAGNFSFTGTRQVLFSWTWRTNVMLVEQFPIFANEAPKWLGRVCRHTIPVQHRRVIYLVKTRLCVVKNLNSHGNL